MRGTPLSPSLYYQTNIIKTLINILLFLVISPFLIGQEICDDGIDNDQDGYIDYYDEDCDCDEELFNAQCEAECVDSSYQAIELSLKWKTDIINQNQDFSPGNLITYNSRVFLKSHRGIDSGVENFIAEIDLITGSLVSKIVIDTASSKTSFELLCLIENNNLDAISFIIRSTDLSLIMINADEVIFNSSSITDGSRLLRYPKASDIDQNGILEIYTGSSIVNLTGELLYRGKSSEGCNFINEFNLCSLGANSIASDFTDHDGLELACGNVVYEVNLINTIDSVGNTANVITAPSEVLEGYTAMGDFDGDGRLEVVSSRGNGNDDGGVWIWNPRNQSVVASSLHPSTVGGWGGVPTIADVNNDCVPEVVVIFENVLKVYTYDGTTDLKILHERDIIDDSGYTIPTVFDLNSDGINEIIYRDEEHLFILDGPSGVTLDSFPLMSPTANEQPIVTDGDGDGHAEILIQGTDDHPDSLRLFCFESANRPWAPARRVWNQTGYHVTNVNDDLTIPQYQQNSAAFFDSDSCYLETCPQVYNTFGVQATYRTQKGCAVLPELELTPVDIVASRDSICAMDSVSLSIISEEMDIVWSSTEEYDCASCDSIKVSLDTTSWIRVVVGGENCFVEDSILIYVKEPVEYIASNSICAGDSILFDNVYIKESGSYSRVVGACDSTVTLELNVIEAVSESIQRSFCEGDSVIIENEVFKDEGAFQLSTVSALGCDSLIDLTISHHLPSTKDSIVTFCNGDSILIGGVWHSEDIMISVNGANSLGCDSTTFFTIELVDILSDQDTLSVCAGDSLMLHGQWQSSAGDYSEMFISESGCDSVFTYHLIVLDTSVVYVEEMICEGDTLFINGEMFMEDTLYSFTVPSTSLCDSTINYTISIEESPVSIIEQSICAGDSILLDNIWISEEGDYDIVVNNEIGCDSILTYQISISENIVSSEEYTRCVGDTLFLGDMIYVSDTILIDTISGVNCDTIRSRDISFIAPIEIMMPIEFCESDTFITSQDTLTDNGLAQENYTTSEGCDSIVIYDVTFVPRSIQNENYFICSGDSIFLIDRYYFDEISFSDTLSGAQCDSIINIMVSVFDIDTSYQEYIISEGESIFINDEEFSIAGEYNQMLTSENTDCDSVLIFELIVEESAELAIPNIFSPNGDNVNDEFVIYMEEFPINNFTVFDRWGELVYTSFNQDVIRWDGIFNGSLVSDGVYVFMLTYEDVNGDEQLKVGDLTVIK